MDRRQFIGYSAKGLIGASLSLKAAGARPSDSQLKKAVLISMLPDSLTWGDRFKIARDVGFEGIEAQTVPDLRIADEIKAASEEAGIRIHSVMNMDHWEFPLSSDKASDVERSMRGMETSLRNARLWCADTVLLVPAVVSPRTTYQQAYARSQKQIRKLLPLAKELNVVIAIEEVWNKFLLSPLEFARYIDEFNSPWVRAYFDVGNIVQYGYPQDWIRTLGKRIVKFHLKDFKRNSNEFVMLREGDVEWRDVRKAIGEIGFQGYLTAELGGGDEAYLKDVVSRMDRIIAGE